MNYKKYTGNVKSSLDFGTKVKVGRNKNKNHGSIE